MEYQRKKIIFGIFFGLTFLMMSGCQGRTQQDSAPTDPAPSVEYEKGADFVGVVKALDTAEAKITFYNASFEAEETYSYSGATFIQTEYGEDMAMTQVAVGEVYDIYTSGDGAKIVGMKETADVVMLDDVPVSVVPERGQLTVQDVTYAYTDLMVVNSGGKAIQPVEITEMDRVTFRGVKGHAYSLIVTRGHGYIRPQKYDDFIGGTMTVYGEAILPVSKDMLLTVPEGTQQISMTNGDLTGATSVVVKRNQVTEVDMSEFQTQVPDVGLVTFRIKPEGAEVYINQSPVDVSKPVSLKYGKHSLKVVLEGYNDYSGIIDVQDPSPVIRINLGEESAEVDEDQGDDQGSDKNDSNTSVSSDSASGSPSPNAVQYDKNHKITVSAPQGAAVYVNGTYKGQIPCNFEKMLGHVTLTLTKTGCETKSYSIEIPDDNQDISWTFPDLKVSG